jgi:hypothetical protein
MRSVDLASAAFLTPALPAGVTAIAGKFQHRMTASTDATMSGRRPQLGASSRAAGRRPKR